MASASTTRVFAAGALLCGLTLAGVDLALAAGRGELTLGALAALAIVPLTSGAVALVLGLGLRVTRRLGAAPVRRSLVGALFALPVIVPVALFLFRGTGIARRWYAPYGPPVATLLLWLGTAVTLLLIGRIARALATRGPGPRLAVGLLALVGSICVFYADRTLYPNQYLYLHWVLLLICWLCGFASFTALTVAAPARLVRPALPLLLAMLPMLALAALIGGGGRAFARLDQDTYAAGRLLEVCRRLTDWDQDRHSILFGETDCDNLDAEVHPFAVETPGNGRDEDCDGQDSLPTLPPIAGPRGLSEEDYRARLAGWRQEPGPAQRLAATAGYNYLLIVVDALRADQLMPEDAARRRAPTIHALMKKSRRFPRTFASSAGTDLGMTTVLSGGLLASALGRRTLPRAFQQAGILTYAIYQREVETWLGPQLSQRGLWGRKVVVNDPNRPDFGSQATSRQVSDLGIKFLQRHGSRRFFLWLHYFDVHEHHQLPAKALEDGPLPAALTLAEAGAPEDAKNPRLLAYRRALRHVDHHLGRFLDELDRLGLRQRTIVVLTADHGEGLATDPRLPQNHGNLVYQPLVHVPLGLAIPGIDGKALELPATTADLYPTLLDLAGIPHGRTDGVSLAPFLLDDTPGDLGRLERPLFLFEEQQQAVVLWPYKLIAWQGRGRMELFRLDKDPGEKDDLSETEPDQVRRLAALLSARRLPEVDRQAALRQRRREQRLARPDAGPSAPTPRAP